MSVEDSSGSKSEIPIEEKLTKEEWKGIMEEGVETAIEGFEILFYPSEENMPFTPVSFSPAQISGGVDERRFIDLEADEREFIKGNMFTGLGIDRKAPQIVDNYTVPLPHPSYADWEGIAFVQIVETNRSEDDLFLHEISFPDERVDYFMATLDYRL